MGIWDLKFWSMFDARYKKAIWNVLIVLTLIFIGLSVPRPFLKEPKAGLTMTSLGLGAKSLIFLAYQISTEYVKSFQRWRSYKANTVLNGLDIVFWAAVAALNFDANRKNCDGAGCYLGWAVFGIAIVVNQLYVFAFITSFREWMGLTGDQQLPYQEEGAEKATRNSSVIPVYATKSV